MDKARNGRNLLFPVAVTLLLVVMFVFLYHSIDRRNKPVLEDIRNKRAFVLDSSCNVAELSALIYSNGYADNQKDADFISSFLVNRQKEGDRLTSLYTLQKRDFGQVPVAVADSCGVFSKRVGASCEMIGRNSQVFPFRIDSLSKGPGRIVVSVFEQKEPSSRLKKWLRMDDEVPCDGVPVRLTKHYRDTVFGALSLVVGYVNTDAEGKAVFDSLDVESSYSVLPIRSGFEYGGSKGTLNGKWKRSQIRHGLKFSFVEREHRIAVFSNSALKLIKADKSLLVRSPEKYKETVVMCFVFVMLAWWLLLAYIVLSKKKFNGALVASCMFLSTSCVLMMFSMQDPLNDEMHGITMTQGVIMGLIVCAFLQSVDFVKFYQNNSGIGFDVPANSLKWLFKPFRQKVSGPAATLSSDNAGILRKISATVLVVLALPFLLLDLLQITKLYGRVEQLCGKLPKGAGWLGLALLLTALLWTPFGQAVGGMRVNLRMFGLIFQPSEIAKYLIILFMAAFFTRKADVIIAYSRPGRMDKLGSKLTAMLWIILGLAILMAMYIALGDMGPGLVIGITFILIYSLVKSKVDLENADEKEQVRRILSCDFATLIYGVLSFVLFLITGHLLGNMLLFGILWFPLWLAVGYFGFRKQLFETALLMNAVIFVFIFGGQIMSWVPGLKDSSTVERFEARTRMCVNTWGDLDVEHNGNDADPVSNTQVANGLWALSTGGFAGQGWGEGKPSLIPAFHTDMILSSIGEQRGWLGLLLVVLAFAILLRRMVVIGYRVGHPFAFYLCLGFAIVIGVQFFIIALGSSGMIPLTGVTVPFLSFGRVSMILNLAAFGIVLSLCNNIRDEETGLEAEVRQKAVNQYSYPVAMITVVYFLLAVTTLGVWQYYQLWERNATLIHPAYTITNQGEPLVDYNPRIKLLVQNMYSGRIYDRNGILLATSDRTDIDKKFYTDSIGIDGGSIDEMLKRRQKRYYPMGAHTFFMVGDQNEGLLFSYNENHPAGYMAEAQHLSDLRGFDNMLYDASGNPVKVVLKTDKMRESVYLEPKDTVSAPIQIRNYSALIEYLKDGIDGPKVAAHNEQVKQKRYDLHLTLDAKLQCDLQKRIAVYMKNKYKDSQTFHLMRVSAVVLDASNGDLLASANYPVPDYDTLRAVKDNNYYSDNFKKKGWWAYSDIDLGTSYQTMPGSSAKVMSAMAGLMQYGTAASEQTYFITDKDVVEVSKRTGKPAEPTDSVTMRTAIVRSSNCYFINLVNDKDLYPSLDSIYKTTGVSIGGKVPYYFRPTANGDWLSGFNAKMSENRTVAIVKYANYRESVRKGVHRKMDAGEWKWAWGQGYAGYELQASPLNMARVASTVVNDGIMPVTQYVKACNESESQLRNDGGIRLMKPEEARILKSYMLAEAANQHSRQNGAVSLPSYVGGKTGTPERERVLGERVVKDKKELDTEKLNDGWYVFFVEGDAEHHPIAVAVRIERVAKSSGGGNSGDAVCLVGNMLLNCLSENHYIRNN